MSNLSKHYKIFHSLKKYLEESFELRMYVLNEEFGYVVRDLENGEVNEREIWNGYLFQSLENDFTEWTFLHYAVDDGNFEIVKYLVEMGAEINSLSLNKETPLDIALRKDFKEISEFLIKNGGMSSRQLRDTTK